MRVEAILRQLLKSCALQTHLARLTVVTAVVAALIKARRVSIGAIGRAISGRARPKHSIKRVDRLLGNRHLRLERSVFFAAIARKLLRNVEQPVIILDWTQVVGRHQGLVAAVPIGGRALVIYEEVHPVKKLGNAGVQERFLQRLRRVLPTGATPVLVTDAGFQGPFLRAVRAMGWDFVARIRGTTTALNSDGRKLTKDGFYRVATTKPQDLGWHRLFTSRKQVEARLIVVRARRRPGPRTKARSQDEATQRAKGRDPWLLATSLPVSHAITIVSVYARRMQIEETFRDAKNHRFGWSLRHTSIRSGTRLDALLLLIALAMFVVVQVGLAAELSGIHRAYQANTRALRVLSLFVLGVAIQARGELVPRTALSSALERLRAAAHLAG